MSQEEIGQSLGRKLTATRRWWRTSRVLAGAGWAVAVIVLLVLVCYHWDRAYALSALARTNWRTAILLTGSLILLLAFLLALFRKLSDARLAADVERRYPILRERLLTTIDLTPALETGTASLPGGFSRAMTRALVQETYQAASGVNFLQAVNIKPLRTAALAAVFTLGLLAVDYSLAPEAFANWVARMRRPYEDIAPWAETRVWLEPGKKLLLRGSPLAITVTTRGVSTDRAVLRYKQETETDWRTVELTKPEIEKTTAKGGRPDEGRKFTYRFPAVTQNLVLAANANDGKSNERAVVVEDPPTLLNFRLKMRFPAYMKRADQILPESTGNIAAPVGTAISLVASANKPLRTAEYIQDGRNRGPWDVDGTKTSGGMEVWKNGKYTVALTDTHGFENSNPAQYEVRAMEDQTPNVQITRPTTDMDLVPDGSVPLVARASDDYGIAKMGLNYEKMRSENGRLERHGKGTLDIPGPDGSPVANVSQRWNIGSVNPKPGETLQFEVTATDTDTLRGPHIGRSSVYRVRVVSLVEMQKLLKEQLNDEARALIALRQKQIDSQRQLQQARLKPNDPAGLNRAQEAQRSVAQEARTAAQRVDELTGKLENNNLATKSELERREAAEKILQTLAQQKMPAAADKIQQAQAPKPNAENADAQKQNGAKPNSNSPQNNAEKSPSPAEKRNSLSQADKMENENRKDIEQAQQMLSRTPPPEQLAQEAARLAQQQQRLADSARYLNEDMKGQKQQTGKSELSPEQKAGLEMERQQQAETNQDTQKLQNQLNQAAQAAQERGQKQEADALRKAAQALQKGQASKNQQQAQSQLNKNNPGEAAPSQDKAAQALQKAADAAQQAASPNQADSPQAAAERLEKAAEQLRQMAQQQREIARQTAQNPNAQQSRDLANKERDLQNQAGQMKPSLSGAQNAQKSLQQAQQSLSQSGQQLGQNSPQSAQKPASDAANQLEKAAQQAERAAQQMRQQQQAAELGEKVEQLIQNQKALQAATSRLNKAEQKGLDPNERRELGQVAARQQSVEQKAKDLATQFPSPAFQQAMNMAAKQMAPARRNLNQDQPNTGTETQQSQNRAAQTMEAIAQALKQQAQGGGQQQQGQQQQGQQQQGGSPQQAQQAAALGDLMLAQALQKQLQNETAKLDKDRAKNPNQELTQPQERQAGQLTEGQKNTQGIAEQAGEQLSELPGVGEAVRDAAQQMEQAGQKLGNKQTGKPTQSNQENAGQKLEQAAKKAQEAMQQQQQQQQAQQQGQQGAPQPGNKRGSTPGKSPFTRMDNGQRGQTQSPNGKNGVFGALTPRAQRVLREGQQERVPAEFQDIVNRYYKSLAEKKR